MERYVTLISETLIPPANTTAAAAIMSRGLRWIFITAIKSMRRLLLDAREDDEIASHIV